MVDGDLDGSFLSWVSAADRDFLLGRGSRRRFEHDDVLLHEGDPSEHVLIVVSGWVRVSTSLEVGREIIYALRGQGDVLGELAALQGSGRTATVRGMNVVEVVQFSGAQFFAALRERPDLAIALVRSMAGRLRDAEMARVGTAAMDVGKRLVHYLVDLVAERGRKEADGIVVDTPLTQEDIARQLGASRRGVARALRDLRARGVVSTGRKRIVVHLPEVLRSLDRL